MPCTWLRPAWKGRVSRIKGCTRAVMGGGSDPRLGFGRRCGGSRVLRVLGKRPGELANNGATACDARTSTIEKDVQGGASTKGRALARRMRGTIGLKDAR